MSWYIEEQSPVYLDYNATTPLAAEVESSITGALKLWANPSGMNKLAKKTADAIKTARHQLGELLHVGPNEVIFTSGGTESNNWIINSALQKAKDSDFIGKPHIITSAIEHPSVLNPLKHLYEKGEIDLSIVNVSSTSGIIDLTEFQESFTKSTCLVTIMLANNETGVIQPIRQIAEMTKQKEQEFGHKIFIHTDAAQAIGKMDIDINELKVDALTVVGHKFYGPRSGALIIRSSHTVDILPMILGGGQERGKRAGTENTPMIVGLGTAAKICLGKLSEIENTLRCIRDYFEEQLQVHLPDSFIVNFQSSPRLPNTSSVVFPKYAGTSDELLKKCKSFEASTVAACHSGKVSEVLIACGLSHELASKTVRFSFGRHTTKEEVDRVIKELKAMLFFSKFGGSLMNVLNKGPVPGF